MLRSFLCSYLGLALVGSLVLVPACSPKGKGRGDDRTPDLQAPVDDPVAGDRFLADSYTLDDPACQTAAAGAGAITAMPLTVWRDGAAREASVNFAEASASPWLKGLGISTTLFGFYQQTNCGSAASSAQCSGTPKVVHDPSMLAVCKAAGPYRRVSIEGVSLVSLANLSAAATFYHQISGAMADLPSARLLVLPKVEKLLAGGTQRTETVDNLTYVPSFAGSPTFVIFPKGAYAVSRGIWVNVNFWEIPWTLAHEFGHHVFLNHSGIKSAVSGLDEALPTHSHPTSAAAAAAALALADSARSVSNVQVLAAVNEGFADLFAYYVLGANPGYTKGVSCFEGNRDVGSPRFANGQAKALTTGVLANFTSSAVLQPSSDCSVPSFQDIHSIGAIFASAVDQMFSAAVGSDTGADAALKKAKLLLDWAGQLGKAYAPYADDQRPGALTLQVLAEAALQTMAVNGTLPNAVCTVAAKAFPTYSDDWFPAVYKCQ